MGCGPPRRLPCYISDSARDPGDLKRAGLGFVTCIQEYERTAGALMLPDHPAICVRDHAHVQVKRRSSSGPLSFSPAQFGQVLLKATSG